MDQIEVGGIVLPGDVLNNLKESENTGKTILGPGLHKDGTDKISVHKPGKLRHKEPNVYWVDSQQKRYVPTRGDSVVGVVTNKAGDIFRVDVGASDTASLPFLAFEGATKRNRPDVKIGDLIYAKFIVANKDMEPEIVCIDSMGKSSGMGVIRDGGFLLRCSLNLVRKLLSKDCSLLKSIGNTLPYEIAVGMNGRIWIKGRSTAETIMIVNTIEKSEFLDNQQIKVLAKQMISKLSQ